MRYILEFYYGVWEINQKQVKLSKLVIKTAVEIDICERTTQLQ